MTMKTQEEMHADLRRAIDALKMSGYATIIVSVARDDGSGFRTEFEGLGLAVHGLVAYVTTTFAHAREVSYDARSSSFESRASRGGTAK